MATMRLPQLQRDQDPTFSDQSVDPMGGDNFPSIGGGTSTGAPVDTAKLDLGGQPPPPTSDDLSRSGETPRERQPDIPFPVNAPRTAGPPSPEGQLGGQMDLSGQIAAPTGGGAANTPAMPDSPTPIAAQPPQTFTPMRSPTAESLVTPSSGGLFGSAGGLLGGGIGVPGGSKGDLSNNSDLLTMLMMLAQQQGGQ